MTELRATPARRIIAAIADAAARWSDADFPPRVRALDAITQRTGYSIPVVEYALDRLFFSLTRDALETAIAAELGSIDALDTFVPRGALQTRAAETGSVCVISSRTTIGVGIVPAVYALCAKCDVLVKDREDFLVRAFFETLAEELNAFQTAARAEAWSGGDDLAPSLAPFDAVVAFGSNETLAEIARQCGPQARFIGFGSRASAGYVTYESLANAGDAAGIARGAARDVALYESEGCLSLHVLFVEGSAGDEACAAFLQQLSRALDESAVEFPPGDVGAARAAQTGEYHRLAAFRAAAGRGAVFATPGAHAIVVDPPSAEPPAFLPRTLGVHFVERPAAALAYLQRHDLPLEGFALSQDRDDVVQMAIAAGAVRLTRFGELQDPPASGHHGGRARITDFVRWIDKSL